METSTRIHFPPCPSGMSDSIQSNLSDVDLRLVTQALHAMEKMNALHEEFAKRAEAVRSVSLCVADNAHVQPLKKRFGMLSVGQLFARASSIFGSKEHVRSADVSEGDEATTDIAPLAYEESCQVESQPDAVEDSNPSRIEVVPTTPRITLQSFDISHKLAYGSQGAVYLGRSRHLKSDKLLAIKIIRKRERAERSIQLLLNEQQILSRLRGHPLLLEMTASFHDSKNYYVVTNYCTGGDLQNLLDKQNEKRLSIDRVQFFMAELVCGVHYLHKNGVVHRDLKPSNILLSSTGHITIADFGLARFSGSKLSAPHATTSYPTDKVGTDHSDTWCGTVEYMPPEMIEAKPYGPAIDVWALGIIMFQMLEGKLPFTGFDLRKIEKLIVSSPLPWTILKWADPEAIALVEKLTAKQPEERITIPQIYSDPFFAFVYWDDMESGTATASPVPLREDIYIPGTPLDMSGLQGLPYYRDPHPEYYSVDEDLQAAEPAVSHPIEMVDSTEYLEEPQKTYVGIPGLSIASTPFSPALQTPLMAPKSQGVQTPFQEAWTKLLQTAPDTYDVLRAIAVDMEIEEFIEFSKRVLPSLTGSDETPAAEKVESPLDLPTISGRTSSIYALCDGLYGEETVERVAPNDFMEGPLFSATPSATNSIKDEVLPPAAYDSRPAKHSLLDWLLQTAKCIFNRLLTRATFHYN